MSPSDALRGVALLALASALATSTGCAWITQNHAATAEYSRQVTVASQRTADVEAQLAADEARIAQLEEAVRAHGQEQADRLENLDQVTQEINSLRGQIEELQFQVQEIKKSLDQADLERERRMLWSEKRIGAMESYLHVKPPPPPTDAELGVPGATATTPPTGDGTTGTAGTATPPADGTTGATTATTGTSGTATTAAPATAEEALEAAAGELKANRPAVARAILQKAQEQFPGATEMDEIKYRIAETYFVEQSWSKAVQAFQGVVEAYPKSQWAAWSMLYQGDCFQQKGQADNAKLFWDDLISKYPKSDAAKEAKKRLGK